MTEYFTLNDKHMNALKNLLNESLTKNNEFEIRFGKFYQDKERHMNFDSNIDIESFYRLKKMLKSVEHFETNTREFIYKNVNRSGTIKKIINLKDNSETIMMKTTLKNYDIYDYDLRLSSSYEKTDGLSLQNINIENYEVIRNKSRITYNFPIGKLDLTIVTQEFKNGKTQTKYEVEFEVNKYDVNNVVGMITFVLQTRQDSFYVISNMEKRYIISEYKTMANSNYFIGAQPETLHKEKISMLYKNYSVTDKADGERAFMMIEKNGNVYYIDNNLNRVIKTNLKTNVYSNTLIDGEIVKQNDKIVFLAFDLIMYNGKDLRGDNDYKLKKRLDRLNHILSTVEQTDIYKLKLKKYYYNNVFLGSKIILDNVDEKGDYKINVNNSEIVYKNDGLIYTPMEEAYPKTKKWQQLLKWKPAELNTIDFYSKKILTENGYSKWQLYVQNPINKPDVRGNTTETVLFDISKLCLIENTNQMTYETVFENDLIDETTGEPYQTNTVIEYKWDKLSKQFVPLRTRWDKTINPRKHGNFSEVACDIWNNINNPVEKELLFKFTNVSSQGDFFFERMRRFHNKIKEYLYNKYCKDTEYLLELCSGRGGDMHKWIYNNIKNVSGYDISEKNIMECARRIKTLNSPLANDYNFYKLDLTSDNSYEIICKNNPKLFNVVCCHFGIHYFFESQNSVDNILKILDTSLQSNGYFVITFMDNKQIDNLFKRSNNKDMSYLEEDGEIIYLLERDNRFDTYGNKLKITLNGNNILNEGSDEWVIDFDNFKEIMNSKGYKCVETELFENLFDQNLNFNNCERDISFLNRYCVFQKLDTELVTEVPNKLPIKLSNQNINNITDINIEFNFDTIDLHQNDISVHKISNLYDIIDVINCVEYKYYKNKVLNKPIDLSPEITFNDIRSAFEQLNIIYNPVFIQDPLNFEEYKPNNNNIYFTYYKHVIEKRELNDETTEDVQYNNWYIVLYKDKIFFKCPISKEIPKNSDTLTTEEISKEKDNNSDTEEISKEKDNNSDIEEISKEMDNLDIKDNVKTEWDNLKQSGEKITIKMLKDLLLKLDLKISGKKEELQKRLEDRLNNCLF